MSLVLDHIDASVPQLHALIIGVGAYPALLPGSPNAPNVPPDFGALEQLSSPPLVANALAHWLEDKYTNSHTALGSTDLLVSDPTGPMQYRSAKGTTYSVDPANLKNIVTQYDKWFARCDAHPENVAFLYWCGHGLIKNSLNLLLAEDCCSSPRPLDHAIDFTSSVGSMAFCNAHNQILIADACQQVSRTANSAPAHGNTTILYAKSQRGPSTRNLVSFNAAVEGTPAFGRSGGLTLFSDVFLRALDELGGKKMSGGKWAVTFDGLLLGVKKLIDLANQVPGTPKQVSGGRWEGFDVLLHELKGPPVVPVRLLCDPTAAVPHAILGAVNNSNVAIPLKIKTEAFGWLFDLPADYYRVAAGFPGGQYTDTSCDIWVMPPSIDELLRCP